MSYLLLLILIAIKRLNIFLNCTVTAILIVCLPPAQWSKHAHIHKMRKAPSQTLFYYFFKFIGISAKYVFVFGAAFSIIFIHSWEPLYFFVGAVANALLSKVFKHIIKQPRPSHSSKMTHGMPSSHAQSMFFFVIVLYFKLPVFLGPQQFSIWWIILAAYVIAARWLQLIY